MCAKAAPRVRGRRPTRGSDLPIVDISPLRCGDVRAHRGVAEEIGHAAKTAGFFYVAGHGIDDGLTQAVQREAEDWFAQPDEAKQPYYIGWSTNHRGYVPQSERGFYADEGARNYEAFDLALDLPLDDPDVGPQQPLLGPNRWPDQPSFQRTIRRYYDEVAAVGQRLAGAFEMYLGAKPGALTNLMTKPTSQLRLLHYFETEPPSDSDVMNMGAHTDYECFTILKQGGPGLEVMNLDGDWVEAPPIEGAFAVNIGDTLEVFSNGVFQSTPHRVVHSGDERFSFPYFAAANYDAVIEPLPHLVRESSTRYEPMVAGHHLLGQLLRDFPYLRERYQRGRLKIPFAMPTDNPFETAKFGMPEEAEAA